MQYRSSSRLLFVVIGATFLSHFCSAEKPGLPSQVFVVPNFHPASCGWLANWSVERNYCSNTYLNHLDRVRDDPNYNFVMSECNNMIAIKNFQPERFAELRTRVEEGRVELVNAFFLESTINLSGGEALVRMGVEGLRWQQAVMGRRPRYAWMIDVCGTHLQMPQICAQLGLDALVYTRSNPTNRSAFWSESPDGSRILTLVPGHYSEDLGGTYAATISLSASQLKDVETFLAAKLDIAPFSKEKTSAPAQATPVLVLAGQGDYARAPAGKENPSAFLAQWKVHRPDCQLRFTGLSAYVDAFMKELRSGKLELPVSSTGTRYSFDSFWIQGPRVKRWFRHNEHALQSAEALATIASLKSGYRYPSNSFYHAWLQTFLNMDRNTLWGAAGGMVFESASSWDAKDRFEWVEKTSAEILSAAGSSLNGKGTNAVLFNPANWKRSDALRLNLPEGSSLLDCISEDAGDGSAFYQVALPSVALASVALKSEAPSKPQVIPMPASIETRFYSARVDSQTGALTSLRLKPSGREMLGGPANVIVAERHTPILSEAGDFTNTRDKRPRLYDTNGSASTLSATEGPLAITVEVAGLFQGNGRIRRIMRFFKDNPRIEFETELNDIPDRNVVVAEFPLAQAPADIRRGVPYGFSKDDAHITGIVPALRWSDYACPGKGGVALLDRGLPGREIQGNTVVVHLLNAMDKYYGYENAWLSGKGRHRLEYALVAHEAEWAQARVPQLAWEYNCPVRLVARGKAEEPLSYLRSSDNIVVEALHRVGKWIEVRLVEAYGMEGTAEVSLNLPHGSVFITDFNGDKATRLAGGPSYRFPVKPQQIITLRFATDAEVPIPEPLTDWSPLVPPAKQKALHTYIKDAVGHPPRGD